MCASTHIHQNNPLPLNTQTHSLQIINFFTKQPSYHSLPSTMDPLTDRQTHLELAPPADAPSSRRRQVATSTNYVVVVIRMATNNVNICLCNVSGSRPNRLLELLFSHGDAFDGSFRICCVYDSGSESQLLTLWHVLVLE